MNNNNSASSLGTAAVAHTQRLSDIAEEHRTQSATLFCGAVSAVSAKLVQTHLNLRRRITLERAEMRSTLHHLEAKSEHLQSENAALRVDNDNMSSTTSPRSSGAFVNNNNNTPQSSSLLLSPSALLRSPMGVSGGDLNDDTTTMSGTRTMQQHQDLQNAIAANAAQAVDDAALAEAVRKEEEATLKREQEAELQRRARVTTERIQELKAREKAVREAAMNELRQRHNEDVERAVELVRLAEKELAELEKQRAEKQLEQEAVKRIAAARREERERLRAEAAKAEQQRRAGVEVLVEEARSEERAKSLSQQREQREQEQEQEQKRKQAAAAVIAARREQELATELAATLAAERRMEQRWRSELNAERQRLQRASAKAEACLAEVADLVQMAANVDSTIARHRRAEELARADAMSARRELRDSVERARSVDRHRLQAAAEKAERCIADVETLIQDVQREGLDMALRVPIRVFSPHSSPSPAAAGLFETPRVDAADCLEVEEDDENVVLQQKHQQQHEQPTAQVIIVEPSPIPHRGRDDEAAEDKSEGDNNSEHENDDEESPQQRRLTAAALRFETCLTRVENLLSQTISGRKSAAENDDDEPKQRSIQRQQQQQRNRESNSAPREVDDTVHAAVEAPLLPAATSAASSFSPSMLLRNNSNSQHHRSPASSPRDQFRELLVRRPDKADFCVRVFPDLADRKLTVADESQQIAADTVVGRVNGNKQEGDALEVDTIDERSSAVSGAEELEPEFLGDLSAFQQAKQPTSLQPQQQNVEESLKKQQQEEQQQPQQEPSPQQQSEPKREAVVDQKQQQQHEEPRVSSSRAELPAAPVVVTAPRSATPPPPPPIPTIRGDVTGSSRSNSATNRSRSTCSSSNADSRSSSGGSNAATSASSRSSSVGSEAPPTVSRVLNVAVAVVGLILIALAMGGFGDDSVSAVVVTEVPEATTTVATPAEVIPTVVEAPAPTENVVAVVKPEEQIPERDLQQRPAPEEEQQPVEKEPEQQPEEQQQREPEQQAQPLIVDPAAEVVPTVDVEVKIDTAVADKEDDHGKPEPTTSAQEPAKESERRAAEQTPRRQEPPPPRAEQAAAPFKFPTTFVLSTLGGCLLLIVVIIRFALQPDTEALLADKNNAEHLHHVAEQRRRMEQYRKQQQQEQPSTNSSSSPIDLAHSFALDDRANRMRQEAAEASARAEKAAQLREVAAKQAREAAAIAERRREAIAKAQAALDAMQVAEHGERADLRRAEEHMLGELKGLELRQREIAAIAPRSSSSANSRRSGSPSAAASAAATAARSSSAAAASYAEFEEQQRLQQQRKQQHEAEERKHQLERLESLKECLADLCHAEESGRQSITLQEDAELGASRRRLLTDFRIAEDQRRAALLRLEAEQSAERSRSSEEDFANSSGGGAGLKIMRLRPWRDTRREAPRLIGGGAAAEELQRQELEDFKMLRNLLGSADAERDRAALLAAFRSSSSSSSPPPSSLLPGLWYLQDAPRWRIESRTLLLDPDTSKIVKIDVSGCHLEGITLFLDALSSLVALKWLDVSCNSFINDEPLQLGKLPPRLTHLYLSENPGLHGPLDFTASGIPDSLEVVQAHNCGFGGSLNLSSLPCRNLVELNLAQQHGGATTTSPVAAGFTGIVDLSFLPSSLMSLNLSGNKLTGVILPSADQFLDGSCRLSRLSIASNNLQSSRAFVDDVEKLLQVMTMNSTNNGNKPVLKTLDLRGNTELDLSRFAEMEVPPQVLMFSRVPPPIPRVGSSNSRTASPTPAASRTESVLGR